MVSVHVDSGRDWRGGQNQVWLLLRGLSERGHRPLLVAPPRSPLAVAAAASEIEVIELPFRGELDPATIAALAWHLRAERTSIVHAHTAHAVTIAGLAGRIAATPLVVAARRVDFALSRLGSFKLSRLSDVVVCVSHAIAAIVRSHCVAGDQVEVIHSGVVAAGEEVVPTSLLPVAPSSAPVVGAIGALVDHKDHATFIDAAACVHRRRPEVRFVIAGSGPESHKLAARVHDRGLDSVIHLLGFRQDAKAVLHALDVFVLSSHMEGLGTSVLDAMAARIPVVATRVGGVPEMIEHDRNGLLVAPRSPAAMATAIERLLDDRSFAKNLADAAVDTVTGSFSADRMVDRTIDLYRRRLHRSSFDT